MDPVGSASGLGVAGRHTLLERAGVRAAGLALVLLCAIVTINVVSRWLWHALIPDDILLVSELMLVVILGPIALVTAEREHIAVTVFTQRFVEGQAGQGRWGQGARRFCDGLGYLAGIAFFGFLLAAFWTLLAKSWRTGEYYDGLLNIPQWPGLAFATLAVAGVIGRLVYLLAATLGGRAENA